MLSLIVIFSCLSVSPNPVVGSAENFEPPLNNSSLSEPEIEIAPLNPEFLDPEQPDSVEPISSSDYGHISGPGYTPPPVNISAVSTPATRLLLRASGSELPSTYDLRTEGRVTPVKKTRDKQEAAGLFRVLHPLNLTFWEQKEKVETFLRIT